MPHKSKEARRIYLMKYDERNREKMKAYRHKWYMDNKKRIRDRDSTPEKKARKKELNSNWMWNNRASRLVTVARRRAEEKGFGFDIDETDIKIPEYCPILGIPLFYTTGCKTDNTPSLDRKDSDLGYIKGNVWIISWKANRCKNNATLKELIRLGEWAKDEISRTGVE